MKGAKEKAKKEEAAEKAKKKQILRLEKEPTFGTGLEKSLRLLKTLS